MNKKSLTTAALVLALSPFGVFAASPNVPAPAAAAAPAPAATPAATTAAPAAAPKPAYMSYSFYADRYRDPFVPLIGEARLDANADPAPQISALTLRGIVADVNGRMALLSSGINSYILRGGRLYDGRNRMVKKISGVIKAESVVLIGADRTVREIRQKQAL